jgi:GT2 family glycosyltransferase
MLLSIITVVKDEPHGFARTRDSLLIQRGETLDREGIEWVVLDSSDDRGQISALIGGNADTPEQHHQASDWLTPVYVWLAPAGVYPAMNEALSRATGEYVLFLNAGDTLFNEDALDSILQLLERDQPVWMFGQVCFESESGARIIPPPMDYPAEKAASFSRGRFPPHQGTVARRTVLIDNGGFDTSYRITADYAAFLRLAAQADPVITDQVLATFYEGGLSTTGWRESLTEFHRARKTIINPRGFAGFTEWAHTVVGITKATIYRRLKK